MDLLQRSDGDLGIDLGRLDVFVAEHLLDVPDVRPALVHQRGHRVAEEMAGAGLAQLRRVHPFLHRIAQMIAAERLTLRREEDGHIVRLDGKLGTGLPNVLLQPCDRPFPDRRIAVFLALAVDQDQATVERQVIEFEQDRFKTPDAGRVQHLQDRPVTQSDRIAQVAALHDPLDLLGGEDVLGQGAAQPGQLQLRGWVVEDVVLPGHPSEPDAQRDEASVLRTEAQRLPVLLSIVEEMPLVSLQHWPGDLDRLAQPALPAPLDEVADMHLAVADGVQGVVLDGQRMEMVAERLPDGGSDAARTPPDYAGLARSLRFIRAATMARTLARNWISRNLEKMRVGVVK